MRVPALALALLLFACTAADDNAATGNELAGGNAPAPIEGEAGTVPVPVAPGQQPLDGEAPEPAGEIGLSASPERVSAGATVTLTLSNGTNGQLGYNLCTSGLQTAAGAEVRTDRVCTMELRILEPGRSANYAYELPGTLERGRYRFITGVERMDSGARASVTSNTIEVR